MQQSSLAIRFVLAAFLMTFAAASLAATPPAYVGAITAPYGCGPGSIVMPDAAARDAVQGRNYILDRCSTVNVYNDAGTWIDGWSTGTSSSSGLAVDDNGYVYVADGNGHQVMKFTPSGALVTTWPTTNPWPNDLAFIPSTGQLIVTEYPPRIEAFTTTGAFAGVWADGGPVPYGIEVDRATNEALVTFYDGSSSAFVRRYSAAGALINEFGSYGTGNGQFRQPWQIAIDAARRVYVTDMVANRVVAFDPGGAFLFAFGDATQFNLASAILAVGNGNLWVATHYRLPGHSTSQINVYSLDNATNARSSSWGRLKSLYR